MATIEVKIIAALVLIIALILGLWWFGAHRYAAGLSAGRAEVQAAWDKDKEQIAALVAARIAAIAQQRDAALKVNEAANAKYQDELSRVNASASDLAQRLRNAERAAAASGSTVQTNPSGPGATRPGAPPSDGRITNAVAAAYAECDANAAQLDALAKEVKANL